MNHHTMNEIRKLLKNFGIQADQAIMEHLEHAPEDRPLHIRIVLEDLTDYGDSPPEETLYIEVEGRIHP